MNKYRINGTATVNVEIEVEAETLEEAMDWADCNLTGLTEYCDGNIGLPYDIKGEVSDNGWIEWNENYSECIEEDI